MRSSIAPGLDHFVYATPDFERELNAFERLTGTAPARGGRHLGLGTQNAILGLGRGVYLEVLGADPDSDPQSARPFGLDDLEAPRLVAWSVRTTAINALVESARLNGFDLGEVHSMSRELPTGGTIDWRLTVAGDSTGVSTAPFVIDWGATPHPSLTAPTGARIDAFRLYDPEPEPLRRLAGFLQVDVVVGAARNPSLELELTVGDGPVTFHRHALR